MIFLLKVEEKKTRQGRSALVTNIPLNRLHRRPYQTPKIKVGDIQEKSINASKNKKKFKLFKKLKNSSILTLGS